MRNAIIINFLFFLFIAIVLFNFSAKKDAVNPEEYSMFSSLQQWEGKYPPDFLIPLLGSNDFSLSDTIGQKVIIINFFATWCEPCANEMPELSEFYNTHKSEEFIMIGISLPEKEDKIKAFVREHGVNFPVGMDAADEITTLYEVRSYPTTVFIGADGKIKLYHRGQIINAEVAFNKIYQEEINAIKAHKSIDKDTYLKQLKEQGKGKVQANAMSLVPKRVRAIAKTIQCPCHHELNVLECGCDSAKKIMAELESMKIDQMTDDQVIQNLKAKFFIK